MDWVYAFHAIFGERVLPLLIIIAAVWFTFAWKPPVAGSERTLAARIFPQLVTLQFTLGLAYWLYGIFSLGQAERYLAFPFILHPILGLLAVLMAHWAVTNKPERNPITRALARLGRWSVLASMFLLMVLVVAGTLLGRAT